MQYLKKAALCGLLLFFLTSCDAGSVTPPVKHYTWYKKYDAAPTYTWHVLSFEETQKKCNLGENVTTYACAFHDSKSCDIYSYYTEEQAKHLEVDHITLFEHEVWNDSKTIGHCAGYDHLEAHLDDVPLNLI